VKGGENFDNTDSGFSYSTDGQADVCRYADPDFFVSAAASKNKPYLQTDDKLSGQADRLS
jgi:hypothetical protein